MFCVVDDVIPTRAKYITEHEPSTLLRSPGKMGKKGSVAALDNETLPTSRSRCPRREPDQNDSWLWPLLGN